jgi:hypothetical protein
MSLTKRHYTKGYYFAHSNSKQKKQNNSYKPVVNPVNTAILVKNEKQEINPMLEEKNPTAPVKTTIIQANSDKQKTSATTSGLKNQKAHYKNLVVDEPLSLIKRELSKSKSIQASDDDDALSLFWIIIVVLIILWALGFFIGSVGSFINLLLVLALILLILWLLRII